MKLTFINGIYDSDGELVDKSIIILKDDHPIISIKDHYELADFMKQLRDISTEAYND